MKFRLPDLLLCVFLLTLLAAPFNPFAIGPTPAHAVDLTSGLVGHWTFDYPSNLGYDSSGMGNHRTVTTADVSFVSSGV